MGGVEAYPYVLLTEKWRIHYSHCVMAMNATFQLSGKMSAWTVDKYSVATVEV
jgi:hypothetical protein